MRSRLLAAIMLTLTFSACQLVWSYDDFEDQHGTGGRAPSSSSAGGSAPSSSSAGGGATTSSSASSSSGCTLDDDMDQVLSWKCSPADAGLDCADEDARVFPGADFEASPIMGQARPGTQPWDFDCDGTITQETPVVSCGGYFLCGGSGFQNTGTTPMCGMSYALGHCAPNGWFGACVWNAENPILMRVQRCK